MCGIAGIVTTRDEEIDGLGRAGTCLEHRGPDDRGFLAWSPGQPLQARRDPPRGPMRVGLAHRRLSILDLSDRSNQPMTSRDGRYALIFNGELYNYVELRRELEALGHEFRTTSDTEVLLAAFQRWGTGMLRRLVAMFAFAILDAERGVVTVARDFAGIKPLYWTETGIGIAFASEVTALQQLVAFPRRANRHAVHDYLVHGLVDHRATATMFESVHRLPPGTFAEIDVDAPQMIDPQPYFRLPAGPPADLSFEEAVRGVRDRFFESVELHLRSDVPVGAALSGGIDSSAIVATMRAVGGDRLDLHAFSFIADDPLLSEEGWVDLASRAARATTHKVTASAAELVDDLPALVRVQAEPFASTSIYAQYRVFRRARAEGIKVMLDGQGADEMFAGYRGYLGKQVAALVRRGRVREGVELVAATARLGDQRLPFHTSLRAAVAVLPQPAERRVASLFASRRRAAWTDRTWFGRREPARETGVPADPLRRELESAFASTSLPALLRYEDRNSMAFSIESRVPFLTPDLADFVFRLPGEYLVGTDATSKRVLREALRGVVPDAILDRKDKVGFATPEAAWLNDVRGWVEAVLASAAAARTTPLDLPAVRDLWAATGASGRLDPRVWRAVNLITWGETFDVDFG
ncbi:MAG TPA: asparagine synthase (glutamine-hydrolyzing) [Acidimicrobiales bacterium]|jgi:asparagine synthase (glutamine-hydrolysing)|nr:asparagine synthase (glutamine-hydrolyzing) [Acidimicrobiales bacterium]